MAAVLRIGPVHGPLTGGGGVGCGRHGSLLPGGQMQHLSAGAVNPRPRAAGAVGPRPGGLDSARRRLVIVAPAALGSRVTGG